MRVLGKVLAAWGSSTFVLFGIAMVVLADKVQEMMDSDFADSYMIFGIVFVAVAVLMFIFSLKSKSKVYPILVIVGVVGEFILINVITDFQAVGYALKVFIIPILLCVVGATIILTLKKPNLTN